MWRRRTAFLRQSLVTLDVVTSAVAFVVSLFLRDWLADAARGTGFVAVQLARLGGVPPGINPADYQWVLLGLVPVWAVSLVVCHTGEFRIGYRKLLVRYARAVALGLGLFILVTFVFKLAFVARSFVLMFGAIQLGMLMLGRVGVLKIATAVRRRSTDAHRVLVVGVGDRAVEFARHVVANAPWNIELLGFVTVPGDAEHPEARPRIGHVGSLAAILDRLAVDEVVFALPGRHPEILTEAIAACDERGVDVMLTLPPEYPTEAKLEIANVSGFDLPLLGLRRTPDGELRLATKRALDLVMGLVGLAVAVPILVLTAIAIKIESDGPVLFKQVRAGRHGRKFVMYKFRSMVVDAEAQRAKIEHLNELDGPVFKIRSDPRITRVGRFIRKTSIDELPQLFNILRGDMSLVGPRPALPSEVGQYEPWQRRRLSVKPGLTGLWQVSGRNQVDFEEWMSLDLAYIDSWSLWLDLKIILRTVPTVLFRKGAS